VDFDNGGINQGLSRDGAKEELKKLFGNLPFLI
jgi:hypothetical protein